MNVNTRLQLDETPYQRTSALFCLATLFLSAIANKYCAFYGGPTRQFQEFSRLVATVVVLFIGKRCKLVSFPGLSLEVLRQIWPLTLVHLCRLFFTLGEITELSTSVVILLKKTSVIFAILAEVIVLGTKTNLNVQISIATIVIGALLGASADFDFDFFRSLYVLVNVALFIAYLVFASKILYDTELGIFGVLFYNSLFALLPVSIIGYYTDDLNSLHQYTDWANLVFTGCFVAFCVLGTLSAYSIISCTFYNSVLATAVIDALKDICITYVSMFMWKDYSSSVINICAVNVSLVGTLIYIYVTFRKRYRRVYNF